VRDTLEKGAVGVASSVIGIGFSLTVANQLIALVGGLLFVATSALTLYRLWKKKE
jgi:hypothetical protein